MIMDKNQAQAIVRNTFENSFDKSRFSEFVKHLLNFVEEAPFSYKGNLIPDAYEQHVSLLERIGKYTDGKHKIDILIVKLKKETSIERARTMQRNFIARYLNGSRGGELKDAALVAFVSPNNEDWRFSLVKMDYRFEEGKDGKVKVKEEFTPARRWSFLVGANENSHTAKSQLAPIIEDDQRNPTLQKLEEAFNIEKATKEFFEKYRNLFLWTKETLDDVVARHSKVKADFESKGVNTVDFSKKLLGQIVFLYFLQKKGWFGVPRGKDWGEGDKKFLRNLFDIAKKENRNYFNKFLEPLFYEALRLERPKDYYDQFNCRIPFLNGGLFDPINDYDWQDTDIEIPNEIFSNNRKTKEGDTGDGILDVFDRYNFTVKEDEPLEKEVAIDPEMLGKVFENLLEVKDRKSKGTYYTPREIVHYMCQESLANYLATELENKVCKEDIERLIKYGETSVEHDVIYIEKKSQDTNYRGRYDKAKLPNSIEQNAKLIDEKLASIRICDPAVGSGAFPVGMMNEVIRTRNALTPYIGKDEKRTPYNFKRQAIQNCLYGVDIDHGAVEIAKLRLWLSLIVDEEEREKIQPLPNLDYKIVCGNSLLGVERRLENDRYFVELERLKLLLVNETNPTKRQEYKHQIEGLISKITNGHKEFDFEVYFSEVFHEKKGFDVVIANPPYIGQKGNKDLFEPMKMDLNFEKKMDYWYFFLHKAYQINKGKGITTFITTNYWITAQGGKKVRDKIVNKYNIKEWINFNENKIFEAGVHTNVFILQKNNPLGNLVKCTIYKNLYENNFLENRESEINFFANQKQILNLWTGFVHFLPDSVSPIIYKLINGSEKLCDNETRGKAKAGITAGKRITSGICNINQGLVTGKDRYIEKDFNVNKGVYIINSEEFKKVDLNSTERKRIKNFYKNSDIRRYSVANKSSYHLIYINDIEYEKELKEFPNIYQHFLRYKGILKNRSINGVLESAYKRGKWWALTTDRPNINFAGEKIVCPQRSSINRFGYSDKEWFASADVYYITLNKCEYSLKYVLSILNSKLVYYWLYYMGKKKGEVLELYLEPLQFIPIKKINLEDQNPFITLVDKILAITKDEDYLQNPEKQAKVKALEQEIDQLVYKLYGLTEEEIKIVEGEAK